jgi:hypothetical protein
MRRQFLVIAGFFLATGTAWGQSSAPLDQAEQVKILLERIQQLEKRVSELESKQGIAVAAGPSAPAPSAQAQAKVEPQPSAVSAANAPPVAPAAAPSPTPGPGPMAGHDHEAQTQEDQTAIRQAEPHYPSLQIRGFGDADFSATDQKGATSGFDLGQLVLHMASPLSRKVSYFGEITFNAQPTGYTVEVERSFIRYDYNDYFKISFGRFHTPIGYWNTAFHHGAWLQTTISRPEMVKFGGTFIPVHFVGFLAEGSIPSGPLGLGYSFGLGNGRGEVISRPGDAGDINDNRAWVANLYAKPTRLYGLEVGGSTYRDKITLSDGRNFREWITGGYLVWTKESPEFLAEFQNVNHREVLTDQTTNSQAFYVQLGYRLPWFEKTLKPYYRFEYTHTPLSEQVFGNQDLVGSTIGLRYDITNYASFKGEYRKTKRETGDPTINGVFFQTDFTF